MKVVLTVTALAFGGAYGLWCNRVVEGWLWKVLFAVFPLLMTLLALLALWRL